MFCLHVCLWISCMTDAHRGQKRVELELHTAVSCQVTVRIKAGSSARAVFLTTELSVLVRLQYLRHERKCRLKLLWDSVWNQNGHHHRDKLQQMLVSCGKRGAAHCWWEYNNWCGHRGSVWSSSTEPGQNVLWLCVPGVYPKESVFISLLFTVVRAWNWPRCE